jgi:hypothetical protein
MKSYEIGTRVYSGAKWCRSYGVIAGFYNNLYDCVKASDMSFEEFMKKQFNAVENTSLPWIKINTRKGNIIYARIYNNENMNEWKIDTGE